VAAWGSNTNGQTDVPQDLTQVVAIAAGGQHSLALKADASVTFWGASDLAALVPVDLGPVVAIAAGHRHCLALKDDRTVVAWGDNDFGQTSVPPGLTNIVRIAAGGDHSLAITIDGTVIGWGRNDSGERDAPAFLPEREVAVTAGICHNLVLGDQCWFPPPRALRNAAASAFSPCVLPTGIPVTAGVTGSRVLNNDGFSPLTGGETKSTQCGSIGQSSLWLHLVPETNGRVVVDTMESTTNTVLAVYRPASDYSNPFLFWATLELVACAANNTPGSNRSQVCFEASTADYLVSVDAFRGSQDRLTARWQMSPPSVLDNFLGVTLDHTNVLVCWPDSCQGYALQASPDLVQWRDVTGGTFVKTNGYRGIRQPVNRSVRFYRLHR
jgi:hypothetical protein